MSWQSLPFLFPLVTIFAISLALAFYVWRRRESAPIAAPLALVLLGMAGRSGAYALELASPDLPLKVFWAKVGLLSMMFLVAAWLFFVLRYTGSDRWLKPRYFIPVILLSALAVLFVWTNDIHHLVWPDLQLQMDGPLSFLKASRGIGFWLVLGLGYLLALTGALLLVSMQLRSPRFFRLQSGLILVSLAVPVVGNLVSLFNLGPLPLLDWPPFTLIVIDAAVLWAILHYHILDISPSARDAIIENMRDGVITINANGRIVDLNTAAEHIIHRPAAQAIGQPAARLVFDPLGLPESLREATEGHTEISPDPQGSAFYELSISPFYTPPHRLAGRSLVLHDVTKRRTIELALHESEERYREISELTSDYAYSFRVDGEGQLLLDWMSDSFSRITGYSVDPIDKLGERFWSLAFHEDSQVALEQRAAVLAGQSDIREFRIVTRNGEVRWVRNGCQPIWDAAHEHVVGLRGAAQDITERRRTEARLQRNAQELRGLYHMGQTVLSSLDLDTVLKQVIEELRALLGASDVSILLLDNQRLVFAAVAGASSAVLQGQHIPAEAGVAGEVARSGRAVRVSGPTARAAVYRDIETITDYHTHTLLAAPIRVGQNIIGVMEAVHTESEAFTDDDLRVLEGAASWAAIAIDNARQHKDLQRRFRESQAMAAISQALTETLDLERIFQLIVSTAQQNLPQVERAVIHLLDEKEQALHPVAVAGLAEPTRPSLTMHPGEGVAGRVMAEGIVMNVPDIAADARYLSPDPQANLRSLMVAPVQVGGRRLGTISVASKACNAFATNDERLLLHLGAQAAIAIEKASLYRAEREQRTLAEALRDTAAALSSTLNLSEILDRVLANVGTVAPHDAASIWLIEQGVARRVGSRGGVEPETEESVSAERIPLAEFPILQRMVETGEPCIVSNTRATPDWSRSPEWRWVRSYVGAPIRIQGQVSGLLELYSRTPGFFTETHTAALKIFADQTAISLQNAQLYQAERQRLEQAVALQRVMQAVSSHLDLNELLQTIVAALSEVANYEHVCVYFAEESGLRLMAERGYPPGQATPLVPPGHGVVGRVIRTRQPILVTDVDQDPDYTPAVPGIGSDLAVPLTHGQEMTGVLLIETPKGRTLHQADLDWLVGVGQQVSVALENARLYADLQNALHQEQAMRDQLVQADKLAAVGQMAASVAHELNNPLQAIQGCLDLAEAYRDDSVKQQHYLVMAKGEVERLAAIVRRMLDYYRPAKGIREWVDVGALLNDVLTLAGKRLSQDKVIVRTEWDKNLRVQAIGNQLKQVFLNIILNAVDAMPRGGDLEIQGRLVDQDERKWLTVAFKDTGVGIPTEDLPKIFEPFYTTRVAGTGLGLAVSHNIITHHRGQLTVESTVGQGSTFTVWLPLN